MIKKRYSKYSNTREPWRFYRVTLCQGTNKCDAQGAHIVLCVEKSWALLLHNQKCPQVNIIRTSKKPLVGLHRSTQLENQMMQKCTSTPGSISFVTKPG